MTQEQINENKSFVAFYFAKFNDDARKACATTWNCILSQ